MYQCRDCKGFVPAQMSQCPNCEVQSKPTLRQRLNRILQLVLGSSVTMTLAACYGTAPPQPSCTPQTEGQACVPAPGPTPSAAASASGSPAASSSPAEEVSADPSASPSAQS